VVPRFQGENLEANLTLVDALAGVAEAIGATVAQVATAWVASRGEHIVPLLGARNRDQLAESLGAADLSLSAEDLVAIEAAIPAGAAAGDRYPEQQMAGLDSER
jgi:aryl-alcohol dehydrogenase-like predicted oxidoreductase